MAQLLGLLAIRAPSHLECPRQRRRLDAPLQGASGLVKDGFAYNEGAVFGGNNWRPFGISYRALVPKKDECTNLLTPTCPSSSHIAYGAIRIEFTFMALGEACGTAAVLAIEDKKDVQEVNYIKLKKRLLHDHQVIQLK